MKRYLAEFIAAFFLVFAGVGAILVDQYRAQVQVTDSLGLVGIALAHGLALGIAIAAIGRISGGHANPAVSFAFLIARRMKFADFIGYVIAQVAGGTAAAFLLKRLLPANVFSFGGGGAPALGLGIKPFNGTAIEVVLTFFLVLVIWGTAVDKKGPKNLAPFAIGLTVSFDILAGGPFTGAAMNPARWFGPALAAGHLAKDWYVWVGGPILGALLASLLYETFFLDDQLPEGVEVEVAYEDDLEEDEVLAPATAAAASDWRGTPSPMTPPSPSPAPSGPDSPMTPPAPEEPPLPSGYSPPPSYSPPSQSTGQTPSTGQSSGSSWPGGSTSQPGQNEPPTSEPPPAGSS